MNYEFFAWLGMQFNQVFLSNQSMPKIAIRSKFIFL